MHGYHKYRDTGIERYGRIPSHWEIWSLKHMTTRQLEPLEAEDNELPYIALEHVESWTGRIVTAGGIDGEEEDNTKGKVFSPGDVLFGKLRPYLAKVHHAMKQGICSSEFVILSHGRELESAFLHYSLLNPPLISWLSSLAYGTKMPRNSPEQILKMPMLKPPLNEQIAISNFLNRETRRIDGLVDKKQKQIELLNEKRIALITRAVTKGLSPNAKMKISGLVWLGDIPKHWQVVPLYARYKVSLGKMLDEKRITGEYLAPYLRNIDIQWDSINLEDLPEMDFPPKDRQKYQLTNGDLLVCEGGEVGRAAMWKGEMADCFYQKAVHRLRALHHKEVPRFFYYVLLATAKSGRFLAGGNPNTIDHLTATQLKHCKFCFPPHEEQSEIAEYLDQVTGRISSLVEKIKESVLTLQEYRGALISAAVTGKIDLREASEVSA